MASGNGPGFSAPCFTYFCGRSPGQTVERRWFSRGSIVVLAEVSTALEGQLHKGAELPAADVVLRIKDACKRYGVAPQGVVGDAAGIRNQDGISVVDSFADNGVYVRKAELA